MILWLPDGSLAFAPSTTWFAISSTSCDGLARHPGRGTGGTSPPAPTSHPVRPFPTEVSLNPEGRPG